MKIGSIKTLIYKPGDFSYYQFIRGGIGSGFHESPFFYQFPDGRVMMYWSSFDLDECSDKSVRLFSLSEDRGVTWSEPQVFMADFLGGIPYFILMLRLKGSNRTLMLNTHTRHLFAVFDEEWLSK